jgi:hypothetical protein
MRMLTREPSPTPAVPAVWARLARPAGRQLALPLPPLLAPPPHGPHAPPPPPDGDCVNPLQVWAHLPSTAQARIRRGLVLILEEVSRDAAAPR